MNPEGAAGGAGAGGPNSDGANPDGANPDGANPVPQPVPLDRLVGIMAKLRSETGCPWDRQQTHSSLKPYLIEEAAEVLDAIDDGDDEALAEELGDLLLQVVFHAQLAAEDGRFDIRTVIDRISDKLIRRHPHVFGDVKVSGAEEVLRNWEAIKRQEAGHGGGPGGAAGEGDQEPSALAGVPRNLPALSYARKLQAKAAKVGFDWPGAEGPAQKVLEEAEELREAWGSGDRGRMEHELGDLLFAVVNLSRFLEVDPEVALRGAARRFARRFQHIERRARASGRRLEEMSLAEMDQLWDEAKGLERSGGSGASGH